MKFEILAEKVFEEKWKEENKGFEFRRESLDPITISIIIRLSLKSQSVTSKDMVHRLKT